MSSKFPQTKPQSIENFKKWLKSVSLEGFPDNIENYYNLVIDDLHKQFCQSSFFQELINNWNDYNTDYKLKTKGYNLFENKPPEIDKKSYASVLDKIYRKDVVSNSNWPELPQDFSEWITPYNCFEKLNDCLRTQIIVKYLDGADFVLNKLIELAKKHNLKYNYDYEAKEKGYYAIHYYVIEQFDVPTLSFESRKIFMKIEIQITTQIQSTIYKLTHEYYEARRTKLENTEQLKWQWDYKNDDFKINYLGHILHYLEGMIIEIRDKKGD